MTISKRGRPKKVIVHDPAESWDQALLTSEPETREDNPSDEFPIMSTGDAKPLQLVTKIELTIPTELYDEYARIATAQEQTIEEVISYRLDHCKGHNSLRGIWFTDSERIQLEKLLQKAPIDTATQALEIVRKAMGLDLSGIPLTLSMSQLRTLKLAMYGGLTPEKFFGDMIKARLGA